MFLVLFVAGAQAQTYVPVTICANYQVDFQDSDFSTDAGDDYYTTNSNKDALGVRMAATNWSRD